MTEPRGTKSTRRRQATKAKKLMIAGTEILPGTRQQIELPVAKLYTHTELSITIKAVRSKREGPTLFVSAAIHGDESKKTTKQKTKETNCHKN